VPFDLESIGMQYALSKRLNFCANYLENPILPAELVKILLIEVKIGLSLG
jgi:hypothetical protein